MTPKANELNEESSVLSATPYDEMDQHRVIESLQGEIITILSFLSYITCFIPL